MNTFGRDLVSCSKQRGRLVIKCRVRVPHNEGCRHSVRTAKRDPEHRETTVAALGAAHRVFRSVLGLVLERHK